MTVSFYHQPADCASVRFNAAWLNLKNTSNCLEGEKLNGYYTYYTTSPSIMYMYMSNYYKLHDDRTVQSKNDKKTLHKSEKRGIKK